MTAYPPDRIAYILTETNSVAVLTTTGVAITLPGGLPLVLDDPATLRELAGLDGTNGPALASGPALAPRAYWCRLGPPNTPHPACRPGQRLPRPIERVRSE